MTDIAKSPRKLSLVIEGQIYKFEANPLGWRFWEWTEWDAEGYVPIGRHKVIPLTLAEDRHGRELLLCAIEDGRFRLIGQMSLFPILDEERADGSAFAKKVISSCALEPTLL